MELLLHQLEPVSHEVMAPMERVGKLDNLGLQQAASMRALDRDKHCFKDVLLPCKLWHEQNGRGKHLDEMRTRLSQKRSFLKNLHFELAQGHHRAITDSLDAHNRRNRRLFKEKSQIVNEKNAGNHT